MPAKTEKTNEPNEANALHKQAGFQKSNAANSASRQVGAQKQKDNPKSKDNSKQTEKQNTEEKQDLNQKPNEKQDLNQKPNEKQNLKQKQNPSGFTVMLAKAISVSTSIALAAGMFLFFGKFLDFLFSAIAAFFVWIFATGILLYFFALGDM